MLPAAALPVAAVETDPAFAVIAAKRAADAAHCKAIDAQDEAETQHGIGSEGASDAFENCAKACHAVSDADWRLARTAPTTLAGVAAVLRFANQIEDEGMEWPETVRSAGRAGTTSCVPRWRTQSRQSCSGGKDERNHHIPRRTSKPTRTYRGHKPPERKPREHNGLNMRTAAFRNREAIVESDEATLVRDVCLDIDKAQAKLARIQDRLETVQVEMEFLTAVETKLAAAIVAALLAGRS